MGYLFLLRVPPLIRIPLVALVPLRLQSPPRHFLNLLPSFLLHSKLNHVFRAFRPILNLRNLDLGILQLVLHFLPLLVILLLCSLVLPTLQEHFLPLLPAPPSHCLALQALPVLQFDPIVFLLLDLFVLLVKFPHFALLHLLHKAIYHEWERNLELQGQFLAVILLFPLLSYLTLSSLQEVLVFHSLLILFNFPLLLDSNPLHKLILRFPILRNLHGLLQILFSLALDLFPLQVDFH